MATLRNQRGEPLLDGDGQEIKEGSVVVDDMFGEGIARGTVPLEHGDGVNVLIDFLGPAQDPKPPASRSVENLKRAPAGRMRTASFTTGTDFESGAAHRARGRNNSEAQQMHLGNDAAGFEQPAGTDGTTPPRQTREGSPHGEEQQRQEQQRQEQQPDAQQYAPWLGKSAQLDVVGKLILSHYEHQIVSNRTLHGGSVVIEPKIRYKTKYEPDEKRRQMASSFNATRLGEYLLDSSHTPDDVKEAVARKMKSKKAKQYVEQIDARGAAGDTMHEQLHAARKVANPGGASTKRDDRLQSIDKFVATDAAVPDELFKLMLYYLSIFIFMCRVPFSIVTNVHFMRFLWILRPNFAKKIVPRTLRDSIANDLLDEAYEESTEIAAATLASVPGRLTLGMDGHKEGKHRHVETITRAKLGVSSFAGAEYMRTKRTTGKNLAELALKYMTPLYIALVADNTGNNTGENTGLFACVQTVFATLFCLGCYVHVLGENSGPGTSAPTQPSWSTELTLIPNTTQIC